MRGTAIAACRNPKTTALRCEVTFQLPDGEHVVAEERYFMIRVRDVDIRRDGWSPLEVEVMTEHRWWSMDQLESTAETVWPEDLVPILRSMPEASA